MLPAGSRAGAGAGGSRRVSRGVSNHTGEASDDSDVTIGNETDEADVLTGPEDGGAQGYWLDSDGDGDGGGDDGDGKRADYLDVDYEGDETFHVGTHQSDSVEVEAGLAKVSLRPRRASFDSIHSTTSLRSEASQASSASDASVHSIDSLGSSHYAGSEASGFTAASETSLDAARGMGGMADSFSLPVPPAPVGGGFVGGSMTGMIFASGNGNQRVGGQALRGVNAGGQGGEGGGGSGGGRGVGVGKRVETWEDRPSFFDYLYAE